MSTPESTIKIFFAIDEDQSPSLESRKIIISRHPPTKNYQVKLSKMFLASDAEIQDMLESIPKGIDELVPKLRDLFPTIDSWYWDSTVIIIEIPEYPDYFEIEENDDNLYDYIVDDDGNKIEEFNPDESLSYKNYLRRSDIVMAPDFDSLYSEKYKSKFVESSTPKIKPKRVKRVKGGKVNVKEDKFTDTLSEILRRYKLEAPEPKDLPYHRLTTNYVGNSNCLHAAIFETYIDTKNGANKSSRKKYDQFVLKGTPTVDSAMEYFKDNKIPYDIRDVMGNRIASFTLPNEKTKAGNPIKKKSSFKCIVYDNHVYKYNPISSEFKLELTDNSFENVVYLESQKNIEEKTRKFFELFNSRTINNFSYRCEADFYPIAISRKVDHPVGKYIGYDMNRCYYTIVFSKIRFDHIGSGKIPVFSCVDLIQPYDELDLEDENVYFLTKTAMSIIRPFGFKVNFFHGFNLRLFIDNGYLDHSDIEFMRIPSRTISIADLRKGLNETEKTLAKQGERYSYDEKKILFRLCNGIMGKKFSGESYSFVRYEKDIDRELIKLTSKNSMDRGTGLLEVTTKGSVYLKFNSRSIYDYIVNLSNYYACHAYIYLERNGVRVFNLRTDSIEIENTPENTKILTAYKHHEHYKFEKGLTHNVPREVKEKYIEYKDIGELKREMKDELRSIVKKLEVIEGKPGTGKTTLMKQRSLHDHAMTVSNLCCRNMDDTRITAETIHKSFGLLQTNESRPKLLRKFRGKKLWLDEFSMYTPEIYDNILYLAEIADVTLTGDMNQITPVFYDNLFSEKRAFFKILTNNSKTLTVERRNDEPLVYFRDSLLVHNVNDSDAKTKIFELIEHKIQNDNTFEYYKLDTHLGRTNAICDYVNSKCLEERKMVCDIANNNISKGVILKSGATCKKLKIYKGARFVFQEVVEGQVSLTGYNSDNEYTIDLSHFKRMFTVGYCLTVHSVQGITVEGKFAIHDPISMFLWNPSILYTAVTRGKKFIDLILTNQTGGTCDEMYKTQRLLVSSNETVSSKYSVKDGNKKKNQIDRS